MDRRSFLGVLAGGAAGLAVASLGCDTEVVATGSEELPVEPEPGPVGSDETGAQEPGPVTDASAEEPTVDADPLPDAATVIMYDTYAIALYYSGEHGPTTGIIRVAYLLANVPVTLDFWHGHGNQLHAYTVTPAHFALLKQGKKVTVETTYVDSHNHTLFIDPIPKYRVPGAVGTPVPL